MLARPWCRCALFTLVWATSAILARAAFADSPPVFVTMWGSLGSGQGQLDHPEFVVLAPDGLLYLADQHNNRVVVYTRNGQQVSEFPVLGPGNPDEPPHPTGIAYNAATGLLYVSEHHTHRISAFTLSGTYLYSFGEGVLYPVEVECDPSGFIYVASSGNDLVMKFAPDGSLLGSWTVEGAPYGLLLSPGGTIYVTGFYNAQVRKYTTGGQLLQAWGSSGTGDGQFQQPEGMWADAHGNLYVVDAGNNRVQKFAPDGAFLTKWGSMGSGPGQFYGLSDVIGDGDDNIYVVEWSNHRMQKFTNSGVTPALARSWGSLKSQYLRAGPQGR
ncbi:MAG TPA: 6-bladed beta-propeller [Gemmatimonadales bacterium]|jgi:DNA-binding beta-propeller fold protein YncE|nr:6-bladed beta-propeller [Gemmatimonadales bacterium]